MAHLDVESDKTVYVPKIKPETGHGLLEIHVEDEHVDHILCICGYGFWRHPSGDAMRAFNCHLQEVLEGRDKVDQGKQLERAEVQSMIDEAIQKHKEAWHLKDY